MNAHRSKYSAEHGVVIPLLAVISLGILTVLIVLGVNASIVKYASVDLRTEVNEICSDLADRHIGAQINIAREFATRVNSFAANLPSRIELVSATLIAPTMPQDFAFPSGFSSGAQGADHLVNPPFLADSAQSLCSGPNFFSSDPSVCGGTSFCSGSTKCMFQGDVLSSIPENPAPAGGAQMSDKYPETMLNNLTNAGNTVLCEFRAKVKNLWLGTADQDIAVRVGFWQPAVGYPDYVPGDPPPFGFTTSPASIPFPGFSIAVATQLTTDVLDPRFQFSAYDSTFKQNYDPNHAGVMSFTGPSPKQLDPASSKYVAEMDIPAELNQARAACMSPVVLARNTYLATLMEMAARHAHFRISTELLSINPQYQLVGPDAGSGLDLATVSAANNAPALIVPFGSDIAKPLFQLPFVSYFGGMPDDSHADGPYNVQPEFMAAPPQYQPFIGEGNRLADGFINPFVTSAGISFAPFGPNNMGLNPDTAKQQSVLTNQLRSCFHLYSGVAGIRRFNEFVQVDNTGFEPPSTFAFRAYLAPAYTAGASTWGQPTPWSSSTGQPLTAAEIAASLGTTQSCPYLLNNGLTSGNATCVKPLNPLDMHIGSLDLRPDIVGTLAYLGGLQIEAVPSVGPQPAGAVKSPGLFPLEANEGNGWTGLTSPNYPMGISNYQQTNLKSSSILIVLHQRLSNSARAPVCIGPDRALNPLLCSCSPSGIPATPDGIKNEVCRIRCAVEKLTTPDVLTGGAAPRPITIAYFPTSYEDFSGEASNNLECAFNASTSVEYSTKGNIILGFTPLDENFPEKGSCTPGNDCLVKYWKYLLTDTDGHNIVDQAKLHFLQRFTAKGLKF